MFIQNRLHFHYENLLHQGLLLKLNCANLWNFLDCVK
jgi:hypothetical protein